MGEMARATSHGHSVVYDPQIQDLLSKEEKVFRIDENTVGISDFSLISAVVAARPVLANERSVFKPAADADIHHDSATRTIRALGHDVMAGLEAAPPAPSKLAGAWPYAATSYLREWLFSSDPLPISLLSKSGVTRSDTLSRVVDRAVTIWAGTNAGDMGTALAEPIHGASGAQDKKQAIALYRRATATLADGVAALVTNALWLMKSAHRDYESRADRTAVLWETLRLLPPAWMLFRSGGDVYTGLHPSIRPEDNIALFPLLLHRDPQHWDDPLEFRPDRWTEVEDPEKVPAFVPFGSDGARCWAKHLVVPLAERLLEVAVENQLTIRSPQHETHVPLRPLLSVRFEAEVTPETR